MNTEPIERALSPLSVLTVTCCALGPGLAVLALEGFTTAMRAGLLGLSGADDVGRWVTALAPLVLACEGALFAPEPHA